MNIIKTKTVTKMMKDQFTKVDALHVFNSFAKKNFSQVGETFVPHYHALNSIVMLRESKREDEWVLIDPQLEWMYRLLEY